MLPQREEVSLALSKKIETTCVVCRTNTDKEYHTYDIA